MFRWLDIGKKSLLDRWLEKIESAADQAAGRLERTGERASSSAARLKKRAGLRLRETRERTRERAMAGRDRLRERVESIAARAEEFREAAASRREVRSARRRRERYQRAPLRMDVRDDDRITLRSRRSVDIRTPDGSVIHYRFYEHPSLPLRLYLHSRGRQVWPRR